MRPFSLNDADAVMELAGNPRVSETTLNIPHPYEPGMAEEFISGRQADWESGSAATFAITSASSDSLLGTIGLKIEGSEAEMGYWIGEPFWGSGYCTEATERILEFAFTELKLSRVIAEHLATNPASGRVMQKAGMVHVTSRRGPNRYGEEVDIEVCEKLSRG